MGKINEKSVDLFRKYKLTYKEAEYLGARIVSGKTKKQILDRLLEKRVDTKFEIKRTSSQKQREEYQIGLERQNNLIKILLSGQLDNEFK